MAQATPRPEDFGSIEDFCAVLLVPNACARADLKVMKLRHGKQTKVTKPHTTFTFSEGAFFNGSAM